MPGSTKTIHQGQAVYWSTTASGVTTLLPWDPTKGLVIAGISLSPDVTFNVAGPFPSITVQSEGALPVPGAAFTLNVPVYLTDAGIPTQGTAYGQAAISFAAVEVGVARSTTSVDLCIQHGFYGGTAGTVTPLVMDGVNTPYPSRPTDAQVPSLRQYLGLGSVIGSGSKFPLGQGDVVIEATSNTSLTLKLTGTDNVTRTATLTLS